MANLYKCSICGKIIKRYNIKGANNFICCNTRQPVTDDNWLNKPNKTQPFDDKGKGVVEEAQPESRLTSTSDDKISKKEVVEEPKQPETTLDNQSNSLRSDGIETTKNKDSEALDLQISPETSESPSLELEKEEQVNPDDYDYSCSKCRELFNKEGNYNSETGLIKCPDCGLEVSE